jgi:hypothetical protein
MNTAVYAMRILAALLAAVWALVVVYDLAVADAGPRKIILHVIYAMLSLAAVALMVLHGSD